MQLSSLRGAIVTCALAAAIPAHADNLTLSMGANSGFRDLTVFWQTAPLWRNATHSLDVSLEAGLGRVSATGSNSLWHVGLTPLGRWWFTPDNALEAGIGATLFSATRIAGKNISTAYQFGDSVGYVHHFEQTQWSTGLRFTHYSNGSIKRPNPGLNIFELRVSHAFN